MIGVIFIKDRLLQSEEITLFLLGLGFLHEPLEMLCAAAGRRAGGARGALGIPRLFMLVLLRGLE